MQNRQRRDADKLCPVSTGGHGTLTDPPRILEMGREDRDASQGIGAGWGRLSPDFSEWAGNTYGERKRREKKVKDGNRTSPSTWNLPLKTLHKLPSQNIVPGWMEWARQKGGVVRALIRALRCPLPTVQCPCPPGRVGTAQGKRETWGDGNEGFECLFNLLQVVGFPSPSSAFLQRHGRPPI